MPKTNQLLERTDLKYYLGSIRDAIKYFDHTIHEMEDDQERLELCLALRDSGLLPEKVAVEFLGFAYSVIHVSKVVDLYHEKYHERMEPIRKAEGVPLREWWDSWEQWPQEAENLIQEFESEADRIEAVSPIPT